VFAKPFDGYNRDSWPEMLSWLVDHVRRIEKAFQPEIDGMRQAARGVVIAEA
jgi:hypothetical protein